MTRLRLLRWLEGDDTTPKEKIGKYTQQLYDLLVNGDSSLSDLISKNSSLLEKLDFFMLKFESTDAILINILRLRV